MGTCRRGYVWIGGDSCRYRLMFSRKVGDLTNRINSPGFAGSRNRPQVFDALIPDSRIVLMGYEGMRDRGFVIGSPGTTFLYS